MVVADLAAVVTEVGWIENPVVLMSRRAFPEAVIVEMLVSALGAVKVIPVTLDNND